MPVFEKGYRRYEGELSRSSRVLAITWENIRTRLRWWSWILLLVSWCAPFAILAVMVYVFTAGRAQLGLGRMGNTLTGGSPPTMAFAEMHNPGNTILSSLTSDSTYLLWQCMHWSVMWSLIVPAMLCAGILASDRRTGALQIYFSRATTRPQYMIAKFLTVAAFTFVVTGLPALLLWLESCLFSPSQSYLLATWYAPFSILLASCFYAYWTGSIVLSLSSLLGRPVLVGVFALIGFFLMSGVGTLLFHAFKKPEWAIVSPGYLLGGLTAPLFGLDLPDWFKTPWPLLLGIVLPTLLLALSWRRVKAIEVHT